MLITDDINCFFCGEPARVDVLEYFPEERSFLLFTCCEAIHEFAVATLPTFSRRSLTAWFEAATGKRVRQIVTTGECPQWIVDPGLNLCEVTWSVAKEFVAAHHRHNDPPPGWKFGKGLLSGGELIGVMMAGRPVAPNIDHRSVIEVTRVCVKDLVPRELGWNACSTLYGYACREAQKKGYRCAISYTRLDEPGTSLLAAGFVPDGMTKSGSWHRARRPRPNAPAPCVKQRWRRELGSPAVRLPIQLNLLKAA